MPLKVLRNHGVCSYQNGVLSLDVNNLTFEFNHQAIIIFSIPSLHVVLSGTV